jgi:HK97 gp10 family phage protein
MKTNVDFNRAEKIKNKIDTALETIGLFVQGEAQERAPYDTGRLKQSIQTKKEGDFQIVYTNVEYAIIQEYGSKKVKAQPYLRPAYQDNINIIHNMWRRILD